MFSHIVIFWTEPAQPNAVDDLVAGMEKYLKQIPGVEHIYFGKMVPSPRPVVDQSYQVALNIVFADKTAHDVYQAHPLHVEFVSQVMKKTCVKVLVYDFS